MKDSVGRRPVKDIYDLALVINPKEFWIPIRDVMKKKDVYSRHIYDAVKSGKLDCRGVKTAKKIHLYIVVNAKFVNYQKERKGTININELICFLNNEFRTSKI